MCGTHCLVPVLAAVPLLGLSGSLCCAGMKELSLPPLNLKRLYQETLEMEPILIIISPGADPSQELLELAGEMVGRESYHEVRPTVSPLLRGMFLHLFPYY